MALSELEAARTRLLFRPVRLRVAAHRTERGVLAVRVLEAELWEGTRQSVVP